MVTRTVLILGASSDGGVGWVTARRFAAGGAKVVVSARRADALQRLAAEIGGSAIACDVSDEAQVKQLAATIRQQCGRLHAVVNAVGRVVTGTLATTEAAQLMEAMRTEYLGNFHALKHLAPLIEDGGAYVAVSSLASTHYVPGVLPYAMAKAALNHLLKYAAVELAPQGIRVNGIVPASIDTPMMDTIRDKPEVMAVVTKEVPLGRPARAEEIAAAAEWLCAPDCFMTGALLPVDGGNHLRRAPFPDEMPMTTFETRV